VNNTRSVRLVPSAECRLSLHAVLNLGTDTPPPVYSLPTTTWSSSGASNMESGLPPRDPPVDDERPESKSADPAGASSSSSDAVQGEKEENPPPERKFALPSSLAWIPANFTWSQLKPVIRCSLNAWVALVFVILKQVSRPLGQVSTTRPWH